MSTNLTFICVCVVWDQAKDCRPVASPNSGFICNLLEWQQYRAHNVSEESQGLPSALLLIIRVGSGIGGQGSRSGLGMGLDLRGRRASVVEWSARLRLRQHRKTQGDPGRGGEGGAFLFS